jgi:hypothetical protein
MVRGERIKQNHHEHQPLEPLSKIPMKNKIHDYHFATYLELIIGHAVYPQ